MNAIRATATRCVALEKTRVEITRLDKIAKYSPSVAAYCNEEAVITTAFGEGQFSFLAVLLSAGIQSFDSLLGLGVDS